MAEVNPQIDLLTREVEEELREPASEKLVPEGLPITDVLEAIRRRKSVKKFRLDPVPEETLRILVEAGIRGQSPLNVQDWHLTIITNPGIIEEIHRELDKDVKFLLRWKRLLRFVARPLKHPEVVHMLQHFPVRWGAPALIILSSTYKSYSPEHDLGYVAQNICLAAMKFGLGTCVLGSIIDFNRNKRLKELVRLPKGFKAFVGIEIGYPDYQKYPGTTRRVPLEEKTTWIT